MSTTATEIDVPDDNLERMPLWRLLVMLDDLEREMGPESSTLRLVARIVRERLRVNRPATPGRKGVRRAHR